MYYVDVIFSTPCKRPAESRSPSEAPAHKRSPIQLTATSPTCTSQLRLPKPCPIPKAFTSIVESSIEANAIYGSTKLRMLRECAYFWYGVCPKPTATEYTEMAKTICDKYPNLKDISPRNGEYWVGLYNYCDILSIDLFCSVLSKTILVRDFEICEEAVNQYR